MQNGCLCCSLQGDLVEQIITLAQKKAFDYMLIEASGVSEPSQIAPLFELCGEDHDHEEVHGDQVMLGEVARLDTCVTVVDAAEFHSNLESIKGGNDENFQGTVAELMMDQVEYANVVVLNKGDLVSAEQQHEILDRIMLLNPGARVLAAKHSKIDVKEVLDTGLFSLDSMSDSVIMTALKAEAPTAAVAIKPCCEKSLAETGESCCAASSKPCCERSLAETGEPCCGGSGPKSMQVVETGLSQVLLGVVPGKKISRHESRFGVTSFVYRARRPFHPSRLHNDFLAPFFMLLQGTNPEVQDGAGAGTSSPEALAEQQKEAAAKQAKRRQLMGEILRSKGFVWLANSHHTMGGLSQAGNVVTLQAEGLWLCDMRGMWEGTPSEPMVLKDMTDPATGHEYPYGDRRQELVFIGMGLSSEAIQGSLDRCLLTDEEMGMGPAGWDESMSAEALIKLPLPFSDDDDDDGDER